MVFRTYKVMGERNTGTRLMEAFLRSSSAGRRPESERDYDPLFDLISATRHVTLPPAYRWWLTEGAYELYFARAPNEVIWKHAALPMRLAKRREDVLFIIVAKNPYSWLLSLFRHPYHCHPQYLRRRFERFIRSPWLTVPRERSPETFENPIRMWNFKYRSYLNAAAELKNIFIVQYEAMLSQPLESQERIEKLLGIKCEALSGIKSTKDNGLGFDDYVKYYGGEQWKGLYSPNDAGFVSSELDAQLVRDLGYNLLT